ncbi:hypothetical protein PFICI_13928 [Pestalotiopsis fici W106-1]|uniref:CCHC-type domain-containing protein n=1 Tax=Pestalotiopsis fici (strain W106-1 / CGMCC3.15140) TaxID=1229662 RepID=W3WLK7_PESFW|nr:uncharacterized protein PFICI_13928 [Pestalotiopsis fici W106-1]ETS74062.1 hypothetical protein PFICI_13928 [Pestalotiopsis fici W106-1]
MSTTNSEVKKEDEDVDEEIISQAAASQMASNVKPELELRLDHTPVIKKEYKDIPEGIISHAPASEMACNIKPEVELSPDLKPKTTISTSQYRDTPTRGNKVNKHERRVCYNCKQRGHLARNCRNTSVIHHTVVSQGGVQHHYSHVANTASTTPSRGDVNIYGRNADITKHCGSNTTNVFGGNGDITIHAGGGIVNIFGGNGDINVYGGSSATNVFGGNGDITIHGESGTTTILGGTGNIMMKRGGRIAKISTGLGRITVNGVSIYQKRRIFRVVAL